MFVKAKSGILALSLPQIKSSTFLRSTREPFGL
jgi:hypothetical protein